MSEGTLAQFDLAGKVAMVTGGGSGLGREFCDVLAELGADVACPDLHGDWAKETCGIIKKYGHRTLALEMDVSEYEQVRATFRQVVDRFGKLDILVNNAGISVRSVTIGRRLDDWHKVIDVNLHGVFYCLKEGLEIMKRQGCGSIFNIASIFGLTVADPAIISVPPYVASKFAVVGLTKEAAAEYGQYGVRVNAIAPGFHLGTRLGQDASSPARPVAERPSPQSALAARTPLRRTGEPRELKALRLYLASDSSAFVTGQVIAQDGGWTIW